MLIGQEKIVSAGEDIVHAGPARLNQQGCGDSVARRSSGKHEAFLDVIGIALPSGDSGSFLRGVVEQPAHLLGVQISRAAGSGSSAEISGDAMGGPVSFDSIFLATQSHGYARPDVVSQRNRAHKTRAVDAELLSYGQGCGNGRAARV